MGKIRVYQVAKELGIDSRELVSRIAGMGIDVRNYMSSLEPEDVARVKRSFEKQRHDEMVEEEIKPGVTRRRSTRPRESTQRPAPAEQPVRIPEPVAAVPPVVRRKAAAPAAPAAPAVPSPPESAVLPSARPPVPASGPRPVDQGAAPPPPAPAPPGEKIEKKERPAEVSERAPAPQPSQPVRREPTPNRTIQPIEKEPVPARPAVQTPPLAAEAPRKEAGVAATTESPRAVAKAGPGAQAMEQASAQSEGLRPPVAPESPMSALRSASTAAAKDQAQPSAPTARPAPPSAAKDKKNGAEVVEGKEQPSVVAAVQRPEPPLRPQPPQRPEPPQRPQRAVEPPARAESPTHREAPLRPEPPQRPAPPQPAESPQRPEPPRRPQPPRRVEAGPGGVPARPEPPGPPARPAPPGPPARPEPPVSHRRATPGHDPSRFVALPPRTPQTPPPDRPAPEATNFQVGPPTQAKAQRGRRQEIQGRDLRGGTARSGPGAARPNNARVRPGRKKKAVPGRKVRQTEITVPKESKRVIRIEETITLQELAKRMGVKATEVLVKLMEMGVGSIHINSMLDADLAKIIAEEFHYQVEDVSVSEEDLLAQARPTRSAGLPEEDLEARPPVVTMLGHVDHGKTSLLDKIRVTRVAQGEAGGITQHIGAYQVPAGAGFVTFIDTPGHEAFTAMRARGAKATDICVLVVAADDGVMPTTREAIAHARAAETPIVVALNKMDLPDANPDLVLRGLAEEGLQPEEWGGDTVVCRVSARTGEGIDQLLEMILLTSEMTELRAKPDAPGQGVVLEAKLEKGRGPVATVLVQDGTLRVGDYVVAGSEHGKIRAMGDEQGNKLTEAGPSMPVEILGLSGAPLAGDHVDVVADARKGEQLAAMRAKAASAAAVPPSAALADVMERLRAQQGVGTVETVNLVIKGDVQGSVEAIRDKVVALSTSEVEVKVIHSGVGGITESDVMLASASDPKATIVGFGVRPAGKARSVAERERVELSFHTIIYELLDDVKRMMVGRLRPTYREIDLGRAEVRQTFHIPRIGVIAGCHVLDGKVARSAQVRLLRDSVEVWKGRLGSLKRFKEDAREVAAGYECGIGLDGYNDLKVGDIIEAFDTEEIAPTL